MAIKIYSDYQEFNFAEPEVFESLDDAGYPESSFDEEESLWDDPSDDLRSLGSSKSETIRDDASFYVLSDADDEELAEDVASYLGKTIKIQVEDLGLVLFCVM